MNLPTDLDTNVSAIAAGIAALAVGVIAFASWVSNKRKK